MKKIYIILLGVVTLASCSSPVTEQTNKAERNAIKRGITEYENKNYSKSAESFKEAMDANPSSERARYNHALATLVRELADTTEHPEDNNFLEMSDTTKLTPRQEALKAARETLFDLSQNASNSQVAEDATYNLGNDAYWIGDALTKQAENLMNSDPEKANQLHRAGVDNFKRAADLYKIILRKKPNSQQTLQNLYITQLRIPPEEDNNGGGGNDNQDKQDQQQQQDQKQQQQQQDQQQQEEKSQALKALENREQQTRRQQNEKTQKVPAQQKIKKPW